MKEDQFHAKGTCRSFSKILARSQAGAFLEVHSQNSTRVGPRCSRPCYDWKLMTLGANYLRLLYFFGLCAWLSMPSASAPRVSAGNSESASAKPIVHFTDMAQKAGLTAPVIFGGETAKKYIIETTGTGVAIFDYDNDGWPDIFVVNGTKLESLASSKTHGSHPSPTNPNATCTEVTEQPVASETE